MKREVGPGNWGPIDFLDGPREKILYTTCVQSSSKDGKPEKPDYLATIDVDPKSATFCQV